jgi:phosphoglycerate dehydrogenase-like enzyme
LHIPVANVPGGSNAALAEYAVTCAAALMRRFVWSSAEILKGNYAAYRSRMLSENLGGLEGLRVGLVGFGTIGVAVARAFKNVGARLCYFDPATPFASEAAALEAESMALNDLLAESDVVSLHVPLIPATRNLIGADQLALMKPSAVLIQAARGGIVDEAALAQCLQEGKLGGAAVDVYTTEPPTADNPLLNIQGEGVNRLLLTPHIAGVTRQSAAFLFRSSWDNVERVVVRGEAPLNRAY